MSERKGKRFPGASGGGSDEGVGRGPSFDPDRRVVAVSGARSFAGAEIIRALEEDRRYAKILAVDIRKPDALDRTQFFKVDLTLPTADADLAELLADEGVDTFVHAAFLAAPTHATAWAHELEDVGTMHVLNACAEARVHKFVLASTTMVYGADPRNPNFIGEDAELRSKPSAPYIDDKVSAERQVRRFAHENPRTAVTVLRAALTLGPTITNYVTRFFARPVAPVIMGFDPLLQFIHEEDVAAAFKLAVDDDFPGVFNLVGDGVLPYSTVLAMMGKLPVPVPHFLARPIARALWMTQLLDAPPAFLDFLRFLCVADGEKARRVLGFAPRHDIRATIQDFLGVRGDELDRQAVRREPTILGDERR
ncbi:MAG TPA: NAD-dependent epimerase/dehydratase family protein [Planctomycetota bacterium]|nr:NAD-dependent epimerase/dehydratase family protein [Planctomycetota bacterium]